MPEADSGSCAERGEASDSCQAVHRLHHESPGGQSSHVFRSVNKDRKSEVVFDALIQALKE